MFTKYVGKLGNYEAECVQAVGATSFASPRWWWDGIEKLGLKHIYDVQEKEAA